MNRLRLDEDEYFSMSTNVTSPGYQSVVLRGYLVRRTSNGTYAGSLLPQMFYGADGQPLTTWRQYLPTAGEQVILSRSGGYPKVPKEEIYWRKIADPLRAGEVEAPIKVGLELPSWVAPVVIGGAVVIAGLIAWKFRKW